MPTKPRREGYLLIDHRNSPGVDPELIRASGKNVPIVGAGQMFESPTITCAHCGNGFIVKMPTGPGQVDIGYCRNCDAYLCDNPACNAECRPFVKTLDIIQEQNFRAESGYNSLLLK